MTSAEVHAELAKLHTQQPLNLRTGSVHAAGPGRCPAKAFNWFEKTWEGTTHWTRSSAHWFALGPT